ncbi:MAG: tyrosyl-tRNA synthetase [Candidatus Peribacteria bacterium]|nr:tyrosyl-tRNA synthetase [Candidatus Peribacteria bacterium]
MTTEELLTRGVSNVTPRSLAEEKLKTGQPIRIYLGIDPTGTRLHLGHAVVLRKLRAFQDAGHTVILVIGSFTAMVGDPSGRDLQREPLTKKDVMKNFESYKEQAGKVLDVSKLEVRYNHEWLEALNLQDILRLAGNFSVQQMLERDMFQKRMNDASPIGVNEFMYPLMVGYDSVTLDVDAELGGNDQYFNMLCGRTLQKAYGKRDKFVLTTKLIEGTDGRKMSKTYDNCIWLEDSAEEMYGKILSIRDNLIVTYMECCTDIPMDDVRAADESLNSALLEAESGEISAADINPKDLKMRLAREIVTIYHGADAAAKAEANFQNIFKNKGIPDDILSVTAAKGTVLIDVLAEHKLVASKGEARRLVEQQGIHIGDQPATDIQVKIGDGLTPEEWAAGVVVRVGKRRFVKIIAA